MVKCNKPAFVQL